MPLGLAMLAAAPNSAAQTTDVDEIVVTANLREQSLQEVPIAVTAFTSEALEATRAKDFTDLANLAPNFSFDQLTGAGFVVPSLRGVGAAGTGNSSLTSSPSVGIYVDGVYVNAAGANLFNVLDVERVEVLRGPQGTLYGRNALAGVVNIVSREPSDTFEATARVGVGNYNSREGFLSISGPLVGDTLTGRAGLYYVSHDGYTENNFDTPDPAFGESTDDLDSLESLNFRGSLLMRPSAHSKILLSADYSRDDTTYPGFQVEDGFTPLTGYSETDGDVHAGSYNGDNDERAENTGVSLRWETDITPGMRLVTITGYRDSVWGYDQGDIDSSPENFFSQYINVEEESFSQEVRLHFSGDRYEAVLGGYYYNYTGLQDVTTDFFGEVREMGVPFDPLAPSWVLSRSVLEASTTNYAVFGNFEWELTERLTATIGGRWSGSDLGLDTLRNQIEDGGQFYDGSVGYDEIPDSVTIYQLVIDPPASAEFEKFTPRFVLSYDFNDDTRGYLSWGRGYRDGGFSTRAVTSTAASAFGPELLTAYEIGLKTDLFDRRLRLNTAAYYYDYEDQQIDIVDFDPLSGAATIEVLNAAKSSAYGAELELFANVFEGFDVSAALGYQHTEFEEFTIGADSREGNEFPRAPNWNVTVSPQYTTPAIGELGTVTFRLDYVYRDEEFTDDANTDFLTADQRNLLNANISLNSLNERWSVSLWGKNLTDEEYVVYAINIPLDPAAGLGSGYVMRQYGDPRTYGVTLSYALN